ncbi:MAG: hypothetical protein K7J46_14555 [Bryobacter sp.]|jgi:hypothetical protein|nr:hypothetical protein [Bryobacter sp. CoA8 C33]
MKQLFDNYFELIIMLVMILIVIGAEWRRESLLPLSGLNPALWEILPPRFFYR